MDETGIAFVAAYLMGHRTIKEGSSNSDEGHYDITRRLTVEEAVAEAIALTDEACRQMAARRQKGIKKGR